MPDAQTPGPQSVELPSAAVTPAAAATPTVATCTVTEYQIRLADISLEKLVFEFEDRDAGESTPESVKTDAHLDASGDDWFTAKVTWSTVFAEGVTPAFKLSGEYQMRFTHKPGLPPVGACYYATVNSVIFLYPYIRQLVGDLIARATGQTVVLPPLDVPAYTATRAKAPSIDTDTQGRSEQTSEHGPVTDIQQDATEGRDQAGPAN